jgi:hypothetical protein
MVVVAGAMKDCGIGGRPRFTKSSLNILFFRDFLKFVYQIWIRATTEFEPEEAEQLVSKPNDSSEEAFKGIEKVRLHQGQIEAHQDDSGDCTWRARFPM